MTYRTHAAHTTCPGCQEEVYLDELVKGRCPLCGCSLEDMDGLENEVDEFVDRNDFSWLVFNYFIFKTFTELGASPLKVMELLALYETGCLRVGSHREIRSSSSICRQGGSIPSSRHRSRQVREDIPRRRKRMIVR